MRPLVLALFAIAALGQTPPGNALDKYGNPGRAAIFKQPYREFRPLKLVLPPEGSTDSECASARIAGPRPGFESQMPLVPADPEIDPKIRLKTMPACQSK